MVDRLQINGTVDLIHDSNMNGYKITAMTQSEYDQLQNKDNTTIYLITD